MKILIAGMSGYTHLGESFLQAAKHLGLTADLKDVRAASRGPAMLHALSWRFGGRRPLRLNSFSLGVERACRSWGADVLLTTGAAPVTGKSLRRIHESGVLCLNYSTDDPWNPALWAPWYLRALPRYDVIFTPRSRNIEDFQRLGCREVQRLPFGYDERILESQSPATSPAGPDLLFVGGADAERKVFIKAFLEGAVSTALVGGYWSEDDDFKDVALGIKPPNVINALTKAAKLNLCLCRRANRDGHVMRSFEIGAVGGCMLVEDSAEHREIFGPSDDCVRYFTSPSEAVGHARDLLADPAERARLSRAVRERILGGAHTYRDRLSAMLEATANVRIAATPTP